MKKKLNRIRRAKKIRLKMRTLEVNRITVHKSSKHIYAQLISSDGSQTLAQASTLDSDLRKSLKVTSNIEAATAVGKLIAKRALSLGIQEVAFDRSGFLYHGRIKALAEAAREEGMNF